MLTLPIDNLTDYSSITNLALKSAASSHTHRWRLAKHRGEICTRFPINRLKQEHTLQGLISNHSSPFVVVLEDVCLKPERTDPPCAERTIFLTLKPQRLNYAYALHAED